MREMSVHICRPNHKSVFCELEEVFPVEPHLHTKFPKQLHPCPSSIQLNQILSDESINLRFCEGQRVCIQRVLESGTEVIYLYQSHEVETKMLAMHTNNMCPLVRQAVEMIQGLILHTCLWGGSIYYVRKRLI